MIWVSISFLMVALFLQIMPTVILHSSPKLDGEAFYAAVSFSEKTKTFKYISWSIFIILLLIYMTDCINNV